ncbi:MAG: type IV toxin-antitoxin system AbiEi family antitoxin domain-containing protein [Anaerolineae bacterium]
MKIVGDLPAFESALLLAGDVDTADVRRQLSRWTRTGKLYQLRRGVYALAPPYQKVKPHPFALANALVRNSYISLQSALAYYDLIPEYTPVTTSVTTGRPGMFETPLGGFSFRHIKTSWFHGYRRLELGDDQFAFVASPEKALLDLVYLQPDGDDPAYLAELRLQNLERLDLDALVSLAELDGIGKLSRAARVIATLASQEEAHLVL